MSESTRESLNKALSAAVDCEAEELELRRVLNAVERDPELRAKWERLHLIGDVMRGGAPRLAHAGHDLIGVGDTAATDADELVGGRGGARWLGPLTGVAVAAAVMVAVAYDVIPEPGGAEVEPTTSYAQALSEEDLRRARAYHMYHAQQNSGTRSPAMPFVKALTVPSGTDERP